MSDNPDETLALLLPLLILLSTLLFLLLLFLAFLLVFRRRKGIALSEDEGPLDLGRDDNIESAAINGIEERWLESQDQASRTGYQRAKTWQAQYQPNSQPTDITLSQFLSIQEKGISAWSFEPDYETNPPLYVQSRTEITFLEDGAGMAPEEGGGCCVQSNLPLPKLNEVYYWECKLFEKPESTMVSIGLSTKPYPSFRLPGWNKFSIGYNSVDGFKSHNYPFTAQSYGPSLQEGDVLGIGYRPRTGAVFFTRNGRKLEDAYIGLGRFNLFPTVGASGSCTIHVNLGQSGFVFIEANVKKWGLAPSIGTLAPPPAYGSERGSILLETAAPVAPPQPPFSQSTASDVNATVASNMLNPPPRSSSSRRHRDRRSRLASTSTQPLRPSPLSKSHTRTYSEMTDVSSHGSGSGRSSDNEEDPILANPPTPNRLDISLRSLSPFGTRHQQEEEEEQRRVDSNTPPYSSEPVVQPSGISPPEYQVIDSARYPAGVAEAMLEDQFAHLLASGASLPPGLAAAFTQPPSTSSSIGSYEGRSSFPQPSSPERRNGGLGIIGNIFGRRDTTT